VHWLNKLSGPGFFSSEIQPVSKPSDKVTAPTKFAMVAPAKN
jgi:hypothetical protein